MTHVGRIPDVDGDGENYYRFNVEVTGRVWAWTIGGFRPYLRIFDENGEPLTDWSWRSTRVAEVEPGKNYYVVANSASAGAYRLRLAGGGRGHDDVGNVWNEAQLVVPAVTTLADPAMPSERLYINYEEDRDYFKFVVPDGTDKWVRIWSSGSPDTYAWLWDEYGIELEFDDNDGSGRHFFIDRALAPGEYRLLVRGRGNIGAPYQLHVTDRDDHGNLFQSASRAQLHGETTATLDYSGDRDLFWFRVTTPGNVQVRSPRTTSRSRIRGILYDSYGVALEQAQINSTGFRIDRVLDPGIYYVRVDGWNCPTPTSCHYDDGRPYTLHLSGEASGVVTVPLLLSDDHPRGQGFVRIINHSARAANFDITAFDDTGREAGSFTLRNLEPWKTVHFNSRDLELGNSAKGINNGVGRGEGDWYLEVAPSEPEVELLSYVRTPDGFLTGMHALVPGRGREHRVAVFNPGSNRTQASRLRLLHPRCPQQSSCSPANVTIFGVDDAGIRSPDVQFTLASGVACEVTAPQLEGLDTSPTCLGGSLGGDNSLGDGTGKWQLFIYADQYLHVMSLLDGASGHLTNLSVPASSQVFVPPDS